MSTTNEKKNTNAGGNVYEFDLKSQYDSKHTIGQHDKIEDLEEVVETTETNDPKMESSNEKQFKDKGIIYKTSVRAENAGVELGAHIRALPTTLKIFGHRTQIFFKRNKK